MAKKNKRKGQSVIPVPIPLVALVLVLAGLSLVYVCLQSRTETLGSDIKKLEASRDRLREQLVRAQCDWARLQSPSSLEQALTQHGLVMTWPARDQIVRVQLDGSFDTPRGAAGRPTLPVARVDRIVMNDD